MALSEASREAIYLRNLVSEIKMRELADITVGTDNRGAKCISENAVCYSRTKHIATRYHFVRHTLKNGDLSLVHVPTENMPADILTKPLSGVLHYRHMEAIGLKLC